METVAQEQTHPSSSHPHLPHLLSLLTVREEQAGGVDWTPEARVLESLAGGAAGEGGGQAQVQLPKGVRKRKVLQQQSAEHQGRAGTGQLSEEQP